MHRLIFVIFFVPALLLAQDPEEKTSWLRLSGGVSFRQIDQFEIRAGSRSSANDVPRLGSNRRVELPASIGPLNQFAKRTYEDGFVFPDSGTGNPLSPIPDSTWNWGYDRRSQLGPNTLTFNAAAGVETKFSRDMSLSPAPYTEGDEDAQGVFLQAEPLLLERGSVSFGVQGSWSFLELDGRTEFGTFRDHQHLNTFAVSVQDTYRTQFPGFPPLDFGQSPINAPPYAGDFDGPGALIPANPESRKSTRTKTGSVRQDVFNSVKESVDLDVHVLSLGAVAVHRQGRISLNASAGGTLHFISLDGKHREELFRSIGGGPPELILEWEDRLDKDEVEPGVYVQIGGSVYLTDTISLNVLGRADWVDQITGSLGPASVVIDLSGYSLLLSLGVDL